MKRTPVRRVIMDRLLTPWLLAALVFLVAQPAASAHMRDEDFVTIGTPSYSCEDGVAGVSWEANREIRVVLSVYSGDLSLSTEGQGSTGTLSVAAGAPFVGTFTLEVFAFEVGGTAPPTLITTAEAGFDCNETPPVDPPTVPPTIVPTQTPVPTATIMPTATIVPTQTPVPTTPPVAVDPTTPTPLPTELVLVPSPSVTPDSGVEVPPVEIPAGTPTPVVTSTPNVLVPAPPETQEAPPPTPTPHTVVITLNPPVPAPTAIPPTPIPDVSSMIEPGTYRIAPPNAGSRDNPFFQQFIRVLPEPSPNTPPGSWVKMNVDPGKDTPMWLVIRVPDPKDGPITIPPGEEVYYRMLWDILYPIGNIMVVKQPEESKPGGFLIEVQEENSDGSRTLGNVWGDIIEIGIPVSSLSQGPVYADPVVVGMLGPDGVFQLPQLQPGPYEMTIRSAEGRTIRVSFEVRDSPAESFAIRQDEDGSWEMIPAEVSVSQLPQTGTGSGGEWSLAILGLAAVGLGMVSYGVRRVSLTGR